MTTVNIIALFPFAAVFAFGTVMVLRSPFDWFSRQDANPMVRLIVGSEKQRAVRQKMVGATLCIFSGYKIVKILTVLI